MKIFYSLLLLNLIILIIYLIMNFIKKRKLKAQPVSSIFDKIEEHEFKATQPETFKDKFRRVRLKVTPYVTGYLIKYGKRVFDVFLMYLIFKLFNL